MPPTIAKEFFDCLDERINCVETDMVTKKTEIEFEKADNNAPLHLEIIENVLILLNIEKQMYHAYNKKNNVEIFSKLQNKYINIISTTLEINERRVQVDDIPEGDYIEFAKKTITQLDFIKKLCEVGEMKTKKALKKK